MKKPTNDIIYLYRLMVISAGDYIQRQEKLSDRLKKLNEMKEKMSPDTYEVMDRQTEIVSKELAQITDKYIEQISQICNLEREYEIPLEVEKIWLTISIE